jgi:hypothetical protein
MNIFKNAVVLRGFLGKDAEVPTSDHIQPDAYAVLTLCIESGVWKKQTSEWIPRTEWLRIICPGPYFCGFTRGMRRGEYLEVEGELRLSIVVDSAAPRRPQQECRVYATQIRRLEVPAIGVDEGDAEDT